MLLINKLESRIYKVTHENVNFTLTTLCATRDVVGDMCSGNSFYHTSVPHVNCKSI